MRKLEIRCCTDICFVPEKHACIATSILGAVQLERTIQDEPSLCTISDVVDLRQRSLAPSAAFLSRWESELPKGQRT
jgi:hypothetical protein